MSKRNNTYYYVFYFEKDENQQFSLKTSDFLIANILKYKIIKNIKEEIKKMGNEDLFSLTQKLTIFGTENTLNLNADTEEEKAIIKEITTKTINSIKRRRVKKVQSNIELKTTRKSKNNIKKHIDLYVNFLRLTNKNSKTIESYIQKFQVLINYLEYKKIYSLTDITKKDCKDLQLYLINFPTNLKKHDILKDKNIFELIDKKDKSLNNFKDKLNHRTVDNYIVRYKTLFNYFLENDYVYVNYFLTIKNLVKKDNNTFKQFIQQEENTWKHFEKEEIEMLLNNINIEEIKNLIVLGLITGARIGELSNLKKEDILKFNNYYYLNIKKSKTTAGKREIPIHKDFNILIDKLLDKKNNNDYVLFNDMKQDLEKRNNLIERRSMYQIRKYIIDTNKVFHSFRKNFTKLLYQAKIEEIYIKIILGHSIKDNLSFSIYNLSEIDRMSLMTEILKIDFTKILSDTEYDPKHLKEVSDNISLISSIKNSNINMNFN